jgi:hypothetical protein
VADERAAGVTFFLSVGWRSSRGEPAAESRPEARRAAARAARPGPPRPGRHAEALAPGASARQRPRGGRLAWGGVASTHQSSAFAPRATADSADPRRRKAGTLHQLGHADSSRPRRTRRGAAWPAADAGALAIPRLAARATAPARSVHPSQPGASWHRHRHPDQDRSTQRTRPSSRFRRSPALASAWRSCCLVVQATLVAGIKLLGAGRNPSPTRPGGGPDAGSQDPSPRGRAHPQPEPIPAARRREPRARTFVHAHMPSPTSDEPFPWPLLRRLPDPTPAAAAP